VTQGDDDLRQLYALRMRAVGDRIRTARNERHLSQEALAERAGIARSYLNRIETQGANISLHVLYGIADALGVHHTDLLDDRP
jgi:transcriptional regulator with XRE-family HTH domain